MIEVKIASELPHLLDFALLQINVAPNRWRRVENATFNYNYPHDSRQASSVRLHLDGGEVLDLSNETQVIVNIEQ